MMDEFARQFKELQHELLELKTAKPFPCWAKFYTATIPEPTGISEGGKATFTIHFKSDSQADRPIVFVKKIGWSDEAVLGAYNASNETQKFRENYYIAGRTIEIGANRPITSITQD